MKLSLCTLGLIDRPLETCILLAAEIGYQGIEPLAREPHLPPETTQERVRYIASLVHNEGLAVPCLATSVGGFSQLNGDGVQHQLDDLRRLIEIALALDCHLVRIWAGGPEPSRAVETNWQRATDGLQMAAEIAGSYGVNLGLEVHYGYLQQEVKGVIYLLEMIGRHEVGVIYDPANLYVAGVGHGAAEVRQLKQHIMHVHIKDSVRVNTYGPGVMGPASYYYQPKPLGEGAVNYPPILAALQEIGYTGFLSDESRQPGLDGADVARQEFDTLQLMLEQSMKEYGA